jgi:hypothetical protein
MSFYKFINDSVYKYGWMARRGQDHDACRGLLEELMMVLLLLSAKCITAVVLITVVQAFPLNLDTRNRYAKLAGWMAGHVVVLYMLLATYRQWL